MEVLHNFPLEQELYQIGIQCWHLARTKKVIERVLSAKHGPGLLFFVIETWHQIFKASHRGYYLLLVGRVSHVDRLGECPKR